MLGFNQRPDDSSMTMRGKLKAYPGNCQGEYAQNDPRRPRAFLPSPHFDQLIASTG
jgi:hypothetical protein